MTIKDRCDIERLRCLRKRIKDKLARKCSQSDRRTLEFELMKIEGKLNGLNKVKYNKYMEK